MALFIIIIFLLHKLSVHNEPKAKKNKNCNTYHITKLFYNKNS